MSFVQREFERIQTVLDAPENSERRPEFYAAQQALAWALDPSGYASPYNMIKGIRESSEDCSVPAHH